MVEQQVKNKPPKKKINYIDNEKFKQCLVEHIAECKLAKKEKREEPRLTPYLGECFYLIALNLSKSSNFRNYSFVDEMVMDGVENCLQYYKNYDPTRVKSNPDKPGNAHAYFSQIAWYAFVRRINKEKKQTYIKAKMTENFAIFEHQDQFDDDGGKQFEMYDNIAEKIVDYETKVEEKKARRRKKIDVEIEALPVYNEEQ